MTGRQIAAARLALHLTQGQAGAIIGRGWQMISRIENEHNTPSETDLALLEQMVRKAKLERPPNLGKILLLRGRVAALKALSSGIPTDI